MTDFDAVIGRIEADFDFYLAVQNDPERALGSYDLTDQERTAFCAPSGFALWGLVALRRTRTAHDSEDSPVRRSLPWPVSDAQPPPPRPPVQLPPPPPPPLPPPPAAAPAPAGPTAAASASAAPAASASASAPA